ncbi:MAG: VWA domain-containing protein, partial [Gemmataceae bacterium]|nr:VWA domain-containing protein [Gemmataceae bacterium]MCI0741070.1 VWA domain-containing protein [Gemmataceae bacterium]
MAFLHPIYLLLALPLAVSLWVWGFRSRWLLGLRLVTLTLVLLALAGFSLFISSQAGTVVVLADRSLSMPLDADGVQSQAIDLVHDAMGPNERLAVVAFARGVALERAPAQAKFGGFLHDVGGDASNLAEALEMGLGLIPRGAPGRILLLSDGQWTGHDPAALAVRAAERGIALDYRPIERATGNDVAIARIDAPSAVNPGESFLLTAWIHATARQEIAYELRRGNVRLAAGTRVMDAGLNWLTFRDRAGEPGAQAYALSIAPKVKDTIPENNNARLLVGVNGPRPILVVTSSAESAFPDFLENGGLNIKASLPENCVWSLEELSKYTGVVLENVAADKIGVPGLENLAAWVQHTGSGLMVTGGRASYGPGGYFKSALDPVLPVSMELRQEHRKLSLAIVVALDRSGSMAAPVGGGRVKMDLANLGAAEVVNLLGPTDELGVLAVDSAPHVIQDLAPVENKSSIRACILSINSQGGGIFVYEALEASYRMLTRAKAGTRHIILFADAGDAEEPKEYLKLLEKCRESNITVSVIGLGKDADKDGELLKDVAAKGGGRCFFSERPDDLPRLFAQDTFVVARSAFLDEPTPIKTTPSLLTLTSKEFAPPALGGYNLCYLRPGAQLAAVTVDEYQAPVVAAWQAGAGRVLCYTGEVDGKYTGAIAHWNDVGDFFTSLARWTGGRHSPLATGGRGVGGEGAGAMVTQELRKGIAHVRLHLDPDRKQDPFSALPEVATLRSTAGRKPKVEKSRLQWTGADTLAAEIPLHGEEVALATVHLPDAGPVSLPPVCLPYSPEFEPMSIPRPSGELGVKGAKVSPQGKGLGVRGTASPLALEGEGLGVRGTDALERLARLSGGKHRIELASIWSDIERQPRLVPLSAWLLFAAVAVFLLEVLERLTGILSRG